MPYQTATSLLANSGDSKSCSRDLIVANGRRTEFGHERVDRRVVIVGAMVVLRIGASSHHTGDRASIASSDVLGSRLGRLLAEGGPVEKIDNSLAAAVEPPGARVEVYSRV